MRREVLGSLVGIGLLVAVALPTWAGQIAGTETVAEWRRLYSLGLGPACTADWSYGAIAAEASLGMKCRVPTTSGELEAYMMYRADPQTTVADTLRAYWREIGCALPPQAGQPEVDSKFWQTWVGHLWQVRTSSDPEWLRAIMEGAGRIDEELTTRLFGDEGTKAFRLSGLLARDRLRELSEEQRKQ